MESGGWQRGIRWFRRGLSGWLVGGTALGLSLGDRVPIIAVVDYASPPAALAAVGVLASVLWVARGRRGVAAFCAALAILSLARAIAEDWRSSHCRPATWRLLLWNVAHGAGGWADVAQIVAGSDADVIALVEADVPEPRDFWPPHLPGWQAYHPDGELTLLTRGTLGRRGLFTFGRNRILHANVHLDEHVLRIAIVDLVGDFVSDRARRLMRVARVLGGLDPPPDIVAGDFNTPRDSVALDALRDDYASALDRAGHGWLPTWPIPFPVLTLDQAWVRPTHRATCAHTRWTLQSDHAQVIVELEPAAVAAGAIADFELRIAK